MNDRKAFAWKRRDFLQVAAAAGDRAEEVRAVIQSALNSPRVVIVETVVDADEKPTKPGDLKA